MAGSAALLFTLVTQVTMAPQYLHVELVSLSLIVKTQKQNLFKRSVFFQTHVSCILEIMVKT